MRSRSLAILASAAVIAVGAAGWIVMRQPEQAGSQIAAQGPLFPGLSAKLNDLATLVVADSKQTLTMVRGTGDTWVLKEKADYPVRADAVKKTVVGIADLRLLEPRSENTEQHLKMGVAEITEPGSEAVRLTLKDGKGGDMATLLLGKVKSSETTLRPAEIFVRKAGERQAWLVQGRLESKADAMSWIDKETLKVVRGRVMSVDIVQPDGSKARIIRTDPSKDEFDLDNIPEGKKPKNSEIGGIAGGLEFVNFDDVAKADTVDMSQAVTTTYRTYDGLVVVLKTAKKDGKPWIHFAASVDAEQAAKKLDETDPRKILLPAVEVEKEAKAVNERLSPWVHQVPDYRSDNFIKKPEDLILKENT